MNKVVKEEKREYSLTTQEKETLTSQLNLKRQHDYLAALIERDMRFFVHSTIKSRLNIGNDVFIDYDISAGKVFTTSKPLEKTEENGTEAKENVN